MRIVGHRGAAALAPENTLAALAAGLDAGADAVEVDVGLTRDGIPVLLHDATLDRTTSGRGPLSGKCWREVAALVPRLEDALDLVRGRGAPIVVEIKGAPWDPRTVGAVLAALRGTEQVVVSSFAWDLLAEVRAKAPDLALAVTLGRRSKGDPFATARRLRAVELHPDRRLCSADLLDRAREAGLAVVAWTVNDPAEARMLRVLGAGGIFTDDPAALRGLR